MWTSNRARYSQYDDSSLAACTGSCHTLSYASARQHSLVWALNPKAEIGSFEPAYLRKSLEARQVPLTKRLLLWLGLTPFASQFESTRLVYGLCRLHGYYVDYPHGLDERYECPR